VLKESSKKGVTRMRRSKRDGKKVYMNLNKIGNGLPPPARGRGESSSRRGVSKKTKVQDRTGSGKSGVKVERSWEKSHREGGASNQSRAGAN